MLKFFTMSIKKIIPLSVATSGVAFFGFDKKYDGRASNVLIRMSRAISTVKFNFQIINRNLTKAFMLILKGFCYCL